jgi:metal-responsive CopG/Arc/MetJ family transcriptional regulator
MNETICVTLPEKLIQKIDSDRHDVSRSRFVMRLLEKAYNLEEGAEILA